MPAGEKMTGMDTEQKVTQYYGSDGKVSTMVSEWPDNHTATITYNEDRSYTRVDNYSDGSTLTRYYDKDGNEVNEYGSPIVK